MWYTLDKTYDESWGETIKYYDLSNYYIAWTLNLERILSLYWKQLAALTYELDPKVVIYPYGLGHY